jgi:universal stress protein A
MKRVKKILCPVDFSEISDEALEIAIQMAEKFGSTFSILYVLPRPAYYDWTLTGMSNIVLDDYFEKSKKEAETKIKNLKQIIETDHPFLEVDYEISDKMDTAQAIIDKAKASKADLVVLGSHGRRGMNRILLGSVAESVLRHAGCAVMIYKSKNFKTK